MSILNKFDALTMQIAQRHLHCKAERRAQRQRQSTAEVQRQQLLQLLHLRSFHRNYLASVVCCTRYMCIWALFIKLRLCFLCVIVTLLDSVNGCVNINGLHRLWVHYYVWWQRLFTLTCMKYFEHYVITQEVVQAHVHCAFRNVLNIVC